MPGLCTYVCGGDIKVRGPVGVWACLFWCFQISTSFGTFKLVKPSVSAFSVVSELGCELTVYSHLSCLVRLNRTQAGFPSWCRSFGQV